MLTKNNKDEFKQMAKKNLSLVQGSLLGVSSRKVHALMLNSCNDDIHFGDMDKIGYVWVGIDVDIVVPVARSDEHWMGRQLLDAYIELGLIPDGNYHPIFTIGADYVRVEDFENAKIALEKYSKLKGPQVLLEVYCVENGVPTRALKVFTIKEFLKLKSPPECTVEGQVAYPAKCLYESLSSLAKSGIQARKSPSYHQEYSKQVVRFVASIEKLREQGQFGFKETRIEDLKERLLELSSLISSDAKSETSNFVQEVEDLVFGPSGYKNRIHNLVRKSLAEWDGLAQFQKDNLESYFGDLKEVDRLFRDSI